MEATVTLADFIAANGLGMDVQRADSNPSMMGEDTAWSREASHYLCTIRNPAGATLLVPFSMGAAHTSEPTLEAVLDAIASDASSVGNAPDWLDWAEELGYEGAAALRQARKAHETIIRQTEELRDMLGDDALETLLYNTERL